MRRGFTVIELMVVVAVIGLLASVLIPTISIAMKRSKYAKCGNNLRQIGGGIEAFMSDHDERSPPMLSDLTTGGMGFSKAILICPVDPLRGANGFNRESLSDNGIDDYRSPMSGDPNESLMDSIPCSYLYEMSSTKLIQETKYYGGNDLVYFYHPVRIKEHRDATPAWRPTWQEAKRFHQKFGNFNVAGGQGNDWPDLTAFTPNAFPTSSFPIVRCYWHNRWNKNNRRRDRKVLNVSMDYNVFDSIPYWECEVNRSKPFTSPTDPDGLVYYRE